MADQPGRFAYDPAPDPRAVAFLQAKGLRRSWRWASLWQEQHAHGFTLAGVWRLDVLDAAHQLTTEAIETGETLEAFRSRFRERMKALGFEGRQTVREFAEGPRSVNLTAGWRVRTIYNTNIRAAYAAAEWQAIEDTAADFPALEYQGVDDEGTRVSHERWFGVVLPVTHIFWRWYFPPNDWGCRCFPIQVSLGELASGKVKLTTEAELATRGFNADPASWPVWTDKRTGRTTAVPPGIGPGFAYNPGMVRRAKLAELLGRRIESLDPDMARAAAADLVNLPQFQDLVETAVRTGQARAAAAAAERLRMLRAGAGAAEAEAAAARARNALPFDQEPWPVGAAPPELAAASPGAGRLVVANPSTIGHSAEVHPTVALDWRRVQQLLEAGELWVGDDGVVTAFATFRTAGGGEQVWSLALKPLDGAWRVRTLFPSSPRRRARVIAGKRLIRRGRGEVLG